MSAAIVPNARAEEPGASTHLVLDSSPVLRWLLQERGWHAVQALLQSGQRELILPASALTEVLHLAAAKGNATPAATLHLVLGAYMRVEALTAEDAEWAAHYIAASRANPQPPRVAGGSPRTLSLGDGLILGQAKRLGAGVLTCDTLWKTLADLGHLDVPIVAL